MCTILLYNLHSAGYGQCYVVQCNIGSSDMAHNAKGFVIRLCIPVSEHEDNSTSNFDKNPLKSQLADEMMFVHSLTSQLAGQIAPRSVLHI
eukprot:1949104-Amphidinium_carterae.1